MIRYGLFLVFIIVLFIIELPVILLIVKKVCFRNTQSYMAATICNAVVKSRLWLLIFSYSSLLFNGEVVPNKNVYFYS